MRTIQEHLDDLDRMIDGGNTPKHELRSQVAFIAREVEVIETSLAVISQRYESAAAEIEKLRTAEKRRNDAGWAELSRQSEEYHRMLRSHELNHNF